MLPSPVYCDNCGAANRPTARFCTSCGQTMPAATALPPTVQAMLARASTPPTVGAGAMSSSPSSTGLLAPHSLLNQRYRILRPLGQGGMGAVYQAEDTRLGNRLVAIKEMSQGGLKSQLEIDEAADAFKREAHMLASLFHRNLPRIYDHFSDARRWYLVMDFIAGETLEEYLDKAGGRLPVEEVLDIGIQLCTVLGFLHAQHPPIIFRDLKPANVMRTPDDDLYLIDFGIARHFKPGQAKDTAAYGSAGYAAPEQYGKAQTTAQSDIYSLGAMLHHLLSGSDPAQTPFRFASLSSATIPVELGTLIQRMLAMDENQRPASMVEVKQELQSIATHPAGSQLAPTQYASGSSLPPTQLAVPMPPPSPTVQQQSVPSVQPSAVPTSSAPPPAQTHAAGTLQKTTLQWNSEGTTHYNAKRYQEALAAYEQAIRLDPNDVVAYHLKGNVLFDLKRYQEAVDTYEQAIHLDPNYAAVYNQKGGALCELKRYQEAVAAYEQAIRLSPNDSVAYINKGSALDSLKRYQESLAAYEQAIRLDPNYANYYNDKGVALINLSRYQEALTAFEQAIRLDPNYAVAYYNKGITLETLRKKSEAKQAYERARQLGFSG